MTISVQRPYDKLFKTILSDPDETESFLRAYLPETLSAQLDWTTLQLNETSFVDEAMQASESDLLYPVQHKAMAEPVLLYILFEHQSSPDKWMRFRLLKYMGRIWDETFRGNPTQEVLPPVLPLVFISRGNELELFNPVCRPIARDRTRTGYSCPNLRTC